jgi:hypothetical protein
LSNIFFELIDPIIEKVVSNLRKEGKELLDEQKRKQEEDKKKGVLSLFKKSQNQVNYFLNQYNYLFL